MAHLPTELLDELLRALKSRETADVDGSVRAVILRYNELIDSYLLSLSARFLVAAKSEEDDVRRTAAFLGNILLIDAAEHIRTGSFFDRDYQQRRQTVEDCIQDFYEGDGPSLPS